jgi:hypothetical protein
LALEFLVGVGHGLDTYPQGIGNLPLRWQALIIRQLMLFDVRADRLDKNLVLGLAATGVLNRFPPFFHHRYACS